MIVLSCHPPRIAPPTPVFAKGFPSPNGNSYRIDDTKRWRTSKTDNPHSHSRQKLFCGNSVSPLRTRMPLPLSVDLDKVYPASTDKPVWSRRVSLTASELYRASATLPISWTFVNSGYGFRLCTEVLLLAGIVSFQSNI